MDNKYSFSFTGDKDLDSLLGFGERISDEKFVDANLLISGRPGAGKTSLACQMALKFIGENNKDRGVILYTTEEPCKSIAKKMSKMKRVQSPEPNTYTEKKVAHPPTSSFTLLTDNFSFPVLEEKNIQKLEKSGEIEPNALNELKVCGRIITEFPISRNQYVKEISEDKDVDINKLKETIACKRIDQLAMTFNNHIRMLHKKFKWNRFLIIFDNINTLFETTDSSLPRYLMRTLFEARRLPLGNDENIIPCFVFLSESSDSRHLQEFMCDIYIHLDIKYWKESHARTLSVLKARNREVDPVEHAMVLDRYGIRLIPRICTWIKPIKTPSHAEKVEFYGLDHLNNQLEYIVDKSDNSNEIEKDINKTTGLARGTSTLIYGAGATRKSMLALYVLIDGREKNEDSLCLLNFTPGHDSNHLLRFPMSESIFNVKSHISRDCSSSLNSIINLEDTFYKHTLHVENYPSRVAVFDLSHIFLRFDENSLIEIFTYLLQNYRKAGITSIFTYSLVSEEDTVKVKRLSILFNNVIKTIASSNYVGAPKEVAIKIEKINNSTVDVPLIQLILQDGKPIVNKNVLNKAFEDNSGRLLHGDVHIHYYSGETDQLQNHTKYVERMLNTSFGGSSRDTDKISFVPFEGNDLPAGSAFVEGIVNRPKFARRDKTEIFMIDEQWLEKVRHLLVPLNVNLKKMKEILHFSDILKNNGSVNEYITLDNIFDLILLFEDNHNKKVVAYPYYINFTTLVHNKRLIRQCLERHPEDPLLCYFFEKNTGALRSDEEKGYVKGTTLNRDLTWDLIFRIGNCVSNYLKKDLKKEVLPFHYDFHSIECGSCLLLALLWDKIFYHYKKFKDTSSFPKLQFPKLQYFQSQFYKWLNSARTFGRMNADLRENKIGKDTPFVFAHRWHISYFSEVQLDEDYQLHAVPTLEGTISQGNSISGCWFLGILEGSKNPVHGNDIINQIVSRNAMDNLFHVRAALPFHSEYLKRDFPNKAEVRSIFSKAISRSKIPGYPNFSRDLDNIFLELLMMPKIDLNLITEMLKLTDQCIENTQKTSMKE